MIHTPSFFVHSDNCDSVISFCGARGGRHHTASVRIPCRRVHPDGERPMIAKVVRHVIFRFQAHGIPRVSHSFRNSRTFAREACRGVVSTECEARTWRHGATLRTRGVGACLKERCVVVAVRGLRRDTTISLNPLHRMFHEATTTPVDSTLTSFVRVHAIHDELGAEFSRVHAVLLNV